MAENLDSLFTWENDQEHEQHEFLLQEYLQYYANNKSEELSSDLFNTEDIDTKKISSKIPVHQSPLKVNISTSAQSTVEEEKADADVGGINDSLNKQKSRNTSDKNQVQQEPLKVVVSTFAPSTV